MTPPRASLAAWDALPAPVRGRLALASTGWRHLARAGADCLRAARETDDAALLRTATDLLLWAWGEAPLHGPLAVEILSATTHPAGLPLPAPARDGLAAVAALWRAPEAGDGGTAYFERLAARRDTARLAEFLAGQIAKDAQAGGAALFWREKALALALFSGEGDISRALQAAALEGLGDGLERTPGLAPVAANLRAQAAFLSGDTEACLAALADMGECFGSPFPPARAGLALLAAGDEARALPRLFEALAAAPWQSGLALVAADALSGARREVAPPPGPVAILLYSWNKADDLDATLASLFASELHGARVVALDNGGTDHTAQVLDAWQARAGGALSRIDLPVNIGAAAARNWLAATPAVRASETLVYLDDDVDLPPREQDDWLGRLGAAMRRMPDAGVWGCKVADHAAPHLLQNVAGMLTIPLDAQENRPDIDWQGLSPNPFRLLDAHLQGPDWGLFDFLAPCSSVTGCCHAFARNWLDLPQKGGGAAGGGGFSLMLMPSQYDDFERDLRMLDGGGYAAYTGHLRVRHRKRSGIAGQGADEAGAGAAGNRYKMQCMHDRASVARHIAAQGTRAEAHLRAALAQLDQTGEPT